MTGPRPGPLCRAVAEGRVGTAAELKRLWRALVRKTHPDAAPSAPSRAFTDLADDYSAARDLLTRRELRSGAPGMQEPWPDLADLVCDLVSSGFPAPDRARRSNAAYRRRLGVLADLWRGRGGDPEQLAAELETLGAPGPVANPAFAEIQEFLYLAVSYRQNRFAYVKVQLDRTGGALAAACRARGHEQTARLIEALAPPKGE